MPCDTRIEGERAGPAGATTAASNTKISEDAPAVSVRREGNNVRTLFAPAGVNG